MEIKNINDYVEKVHAKFPEFTEKEIKRILVYGWKLIILYVSAGNDIQMINKGDFLFIGKIPVSGLSTFRKYCYKLSKKIQYMFFRKKEKWDGYYYFSRSEYLMKEYLSLSRKLYKVFTNVFLYKLLEEVKVRDYSAPYIFRLKEDRTLWMRKYYPQIKTKNAELIIQRDPLNFLEVMVSLNKYKYIQ